MSGLPTDGPNLRWAALEIIDPPRKVASFWGLQRKPVLNYLLWGAEIIGLFKLSNIVEFVDIFKTRTQCKPVSIFDGISRYAQECKWYACLIRFLPLSLSLTTHPSQLLNLNALKILAISDSMESSGESWANEEHFLSTSQSDLISVEFLSYSVSTNYSS